MAVNVNPPPQLRIPDKFFNDQEIRSFFERQRAILFQLWQRTGGASDYISGKQIVTITSTSTTLDTFGALIVVDASDAPVTITLPVISPNSVSETIDIAILDATYDTTVLPQNATIFGDTSVIMTQQYMSIQYTAVATNTWIGT